MNGKRRLGMGCAIILSATAAYAAVPEITSVTMSQPETTRRVTINYTLVNAPAVVTVDIQTNAGDNVWASIGGENVQFMTGDVNRRVDGDGAHVIRWRADQSWPDHLIADGGARAVVTAWAMDNTPPYMVVDISATASRNSPKYYQSADFLPGGLFSNPVYRTTSLVMRKIIARDVNWTMGSVNEAGRDPARETAHGVTLTNNYYMGVFQVTQTQWALVQSAKPSPSAFANEGSKAMRPVEQVCYNEIRNAANSSTANSAYEWPNDPNPNSFLGLLRTKTGLDFDLPSEAQWEFACRAGNGEGRWGDGSQYQSAGEDSNLPGRYKLNGGYVNGTKYPSTDCDATSATAIVGSYAPNAWGLYDMHGNVMEWCLDWYEDDISSFNGCPNIDPMNPGRTLSGSSGSTRVKRGGSWDLPAADSRSACRYYYNPSYAYNNLGLRLVCTAGLD